MSSSYMAVVCGTGDCPSGTLSASRSGSAHPWMRALMHARSRTLFFLPKMLSGQGVLLQ